MRKLSHLGTPARSSATRAGRIVLPMAEVSHHGSVELRWAFGEAWLCHTGTGEAVRLPSARNLGFNEDGRAFLGRVGEDPRESGQGALEQPGASVWANDILKKSLHETVGPPPRRFIRDNARGISTWLDDAACKHMSKVWTHSVQGAGDIHFNGRVWVYDIPQYGSQVFFELPYLQNLLQGSCARPWVKDSVKSWRKLLASLEFPPECIRTGMLSMQRKARRSAKAVAPRELLGATREPVCDVRAAMMILCSSSRRHAKRPECESQRAPKILFAMIDMFFHDSLTILSLDGALDTIPGDCGRAGRLLEVQNGYISVERLACITGRSVADKLHIETMELQPLAGVGLVHLSVALRYFSRKAFSSCSAQVAKQRWAGLATSIAWHIEVKRGTELYQQGADHKLPILRATKKHRRIPQGFKMQLVDTAATGRKKCTPQQLLHAKRLWGQRGKEEKDIEDMTTKTWDFEVMYQYMWAGREMLKHENVFCLALDGMRVATEETLLTVVFSPGAQMSCWLPIQVPTAPPHPN